MSARNTCPFFHLYFQEKLQLKNEDRHQGMAESVVNRRA